jgi:hypothetical protein
MASKRRKSYNTPVFSPVKYAVVPPKKAPNNHVSIYYLQKLYSLGKPTYTLSVSVKFLLESVLFINNNCPFLYLCWPFFFMKHSWTNSFNLQYIEWGRCLTGREVFYIINIYSINSQSRAS